MSYEAKDLKRIEDIVWRAAGRSWKAQQLAQQMANSIKDRYKAFRRAKAAAALKQHDLAAIFYVRYGELKAGC